MARITADELHEKARDDPEVAKVLGLSSFWEKLLSKDKNGRIYSTINNALLILRNDEALKSKVALNEFANQLDIRGALPWGKAKGTWSDSDDAELRYYFETSYNFTGKSKIDDAFAIATSRLKFHPVREYLSGLQWDGQQRLDALLIDYFGSEDNEYTRMVTRKSFTAAVARVYKPGIKFDTMLVLVGNQGIGKSTFFRLLAGDEWFTDDLRMEDMKNKTGAEKMPGKWIIEVAELAGLRKTEVEEVKSFLSRNFDRYREPYGRRSKDQLRQCILVGTTNAVDGFLRDQTGNRRFWPVRVSRGKLKPWEIDKVRNQIWAEAKKYYETGEALYLTHEVEQLATAVQEEYTEISPWYGLIDKYLSEKSMGVVCGIEIWIHALSGDKNKYGHREQQEISNVMKKIPGWEPGGRERIPEYGRQRVYRRIS
ncbi:virulence-associated E family protein [Desulfoscipio gibsoniae]|uniref:Putative P-loop ATPase n=1 Tax=Desulfoscipio gibsoniae DSM 7213 TaxID=767817 RepID=R4KD68_9FIRM|nr:virulence-associated E family protein [Desulfoscipio gibsoniae]AGK99646.1 putative P-loop ATPase [Desulfoscipio gibsoniae DSM 7213]